MAATGQQFLWLQPKNLSHIAHFDIVMKKIRKALQKSVQANHLEVIKLLMESVEDINFVDEDGDTLLSVALKFPGYSSPEVVEYLADRGVDLETRQRQCCKMIRSSFETTLAKMSKGSPYLLTESAKGNTALFYGVYLSHKDETVDLLLNHQSSNELTYTRTKELALSTTLVLEKKNRRFSRK